MAERNEPRKRKRNYKQLAYFYLGDKLHKVLLVNRPADLVYTWNYTDHKQQVYVWSDTKRRCQRALHTREVTQLINRHLWNVLNYISEGAIPPPQKSYTLDEKRKPIKYLWSHADVYRLHDYLLTVSPGRPRNDGIVIPYRLPTRAELQAMLNDDVILYTKTKDGEFKPVWKEHTW